MNEHRQKNNRRALLLRKQNGQGIAEGAFAFVFMFIVVLLCLEILLNIGLSSYYKDKIGFVANQTAILTAASASVTKPTDISATCFLKTLLGQLGPNFARAAKNAGAKINPVSIGGQSGYKVEVTVPDLPLICFGTLLPGDITMQDTAVASSPPLRTQAGWLADTPGFIAVSLNQASKNAQGQAESLVGQVPFGPSGQAAILVPLLNNPMPTGKSIFSSTGISLSGQYNPPTN